MLIWSTPLTFSSETSEIYFSALWRFSNLVAILMSSPWAPSCPIFNKGVIWTSGLGFYTSTKCSSDKCCLFFFSTKVFVLNYATEGKMLYGASYNVSWNWLSHVVYISEFFIHCEAIFLSKHHQTRAKMYWNATVI